MVIFNSFKIISYRYGQGLSLIEDFTKGKGFIDLTKLLPAAVFSILLLTFCEEALAVGGISNTKIIVPSAETVPQRHFEIEPFFGLVFVDDEDNSVGFDAGSRITFGVLDNLEAGANIGYLSIADSDVIDTEGEFGNVEAGMKFRFIDEDDKFPFSLAYQGGVTLPTSRSDDQWVFEPFGLILTKNFSDSFSADADFVLVLVGDKSVGFVTEIGFGYFVEPWLQPVIEAGYSLESAEGDEIISVFNVTAGFTAPVSEMLTIIFGVTPDVHQTNVEKELLITVAFTFLF